jgi:hypothetical protein
MRARGPRRLDLVERSGDLKRALVKFASAPRFDDAFQDALARRHGPDVTELDEGAVANVIDYLALQYRLPDGDTVVERFVAEHPELTQEGRALLLGWRDVVEGIFEVGRPDGEALAIVNLIDELTYRVRSNMGRSVFARMRPRSFLITRLVPVGEEWLMSGVAHTLPAEARATALRTAAELAARNPALVFRNPAKLAHGWALQREEREHFVAFFGADLVVLPGRELAERMRAYGHFRTHDVRDADGRSAADRQREVHGRDPPPLDLAPPDFDEVETVGVVYDEVDGLNFLANFGLLQEVFADPALAGKRAHRDAVLGYLDEPSIPPMALRRLAEPDPERASRVFRRVLREPAFSWARDGEALLRRRKASYFAQPVLPSVTPFSERLARAQRRPPEPGERERTDRRSARRSRPGAGRGSGRSR